MEEVAARLEAPIVRADADALAPYAPLRIALRGAHQVANAAVAVRVLEQLDRQGVSVSAAATRLGLEQVVWPGRLEVRRLPDGREVLLDAAHNADGALALRDYLASSAPRPMVFAAMRDKDAATMIETLAPVVSAFVMTRASNATIQRPVGARRAGPPRQPEPHDRRRAHGRFSDCARVASLARDRCRRLDLSARRRD